MRRTPEKVFPISMKVEPKSKSDLTRLASTLQLLCDKDPTLSITTNSESGEIWLHGQGELQLDIAIDTLINQYSVAATPGAPEIAYLEQLFSGASAIAIGEFVRERTNDYALVELRVERNVEGTGNSINFDVPDENWNQNNDQVITKGINSALANGVLIHAPMVDVGVTILDAKLDEPSPSTSLEIAAQWAMKEACVKAGVQILEPVMLVKVVGPEKYAQIVLSDIDTRRGTVNNQTTMNGIVCVEALVPIASLFGYLSLNSAQ